MIDHPFLATRRFNEADQLHFAELTGDWNPIHVDPLAARRTAAGRPVVHGIHLLLWALDTLAARGVLGAAPARLAVSFARFVLVGDEATLRVVADSPDRLHAVVIVADAVRCEMKLTRGDLDAARIEREAATPPYEPTRIPLDLAEDEIEGLAGRIGPAVLASVLARTFPHAARVLGTGRVASLGASTRLVGMVCPGRHSLFGGLTLAVDTGSGDGTIGFSARGPRHGLVTIRIAGAGLSGTLTTFVRPKPSSQRSVASLAAFVAPDAFAGAHALVIGGSRGLGELTAKLLAAGGAHVSITWSRGEADALAVADEIRTAGRNCDVFRYRAEEDAATQLAALRTPPSHIYYYATPLIAQPTSRFFDAARLAAFHRVFVDGFWSVAEAVRRSRPDARLFYPSTVYVERRPAGLAEYAMAKAAGEILCAEITARMAPLEAVSMRLPRLATDQTAAIGGSDADDALATLLPIIDAVQRAPG